jgi:hypothetical protein
VLVIGLGGVTTASKVKALVEPTVIEPGIVKVRV